VACKETHGQLYEEVCLLPCLQQQCCCSAKADRQGCDGLHGSIEHHAAAPLVQASALAAYEQAQGLPQTDSLHPGACMLLAAACGSVCATHHLPSAPLELDAIHPLPHSDQLCGPPTALYCCI
jgi:hypothetical protein